MDIMILTFQISSYFVKTEIQVISLGKIDTQDLVPNFSRTDGFKYSFF